MKPRIAVTPRSMSEHGHPALGLLGERGYEVVFPAPGRQPTELELIDALPGCVGYIAGVEPVTRAVLDATDTLKVISRNGVGVDNIDLAAAAAKGVRIEKALGANTRGVAELAIALTLCGLRHIAWSDRVLKGGDWKRRKGGEAEGRTLGIVGLGSIGRTVATLANAFGMRVVGHDPFLNAIGIDEPRVRLTSLEEVFATADVITLHCPPGPAPLVDQEAVSAMRRGVVLINTARAELIDENAVLGGLSSGAIAAYATDVYTAEPPQLNELLRHENTILTPHAGGFTDESVERATTIAVENLLRGLETEDSSKT